MANCHTPPGPWESPDTILTFFQTRSSGVLAAGAFITLFGGFATAFTMISPSSILWTLTQPGIVQDRSLVQALYWLDEALGGTGYSVPFGLLVAGISVSAGLAKLLLKSIVFQDS